ncbi:MAG: hypothetical protein ACTHJN_02785, partial [Ginsengibacter sp.]
MFLQQNCESKASHKIFFVIDEGVVKFNPDLPSQIGSYFSGSCLNLISEIMIIPGGEKAKNNRHFFD